MIRFSLDSGPPIIGIENLIRYYQKRSDGLISIVSAQFVHGKPAPVAVRAHGMTNTLHRACQQGNFEIVKKIFSSEHDSDRPDINAKDSQGSTALHLASHFGYDDIVRLLLKHGADISARDCQGSPSTHRVRSTE